MSPTITDEPAEELPLVERGILPDRYGVPMQRAFIDRVSPLLTPDVSVLDVGAGRSPTIAPAARPARCRYVGIDISAEELDAASKGAYDDAFVHDVTAPMPSRAGNFDVAITWQVLEHVDSTTAAFRTIHDVLKPGGVMVVQVSGSFAVFAIAARLMPHRLRSTLMSRVLGMPAEEKFPTRYDHCWATAIDRALKGWSRVEVIPHYRGAVYLNGSGVLQRGYLRYETAMMRRGVANAATHYLIVAER